MGSFHLKTWIFQKVKKHHAWNRNRSKKRKSVFSFHYLSLPSSLFTFADKPYVTQLIIWSLGWKFPTKEGWEWNVTFRDEIFAPRGSSERDSQVPLPFFLCVAFHQSSPHQASVENLSAWFPGCYRSRTCLCWRVSKNASFADYSSPLGCRAPIEKQVVQKLSESGLLGEDAKNIYRLLDDGQSNWLTPDKQPLGWVVALGGTIKNYFNSYEREIVSKIRNCQVESHNNYLLSFVLSLTIELLYSKSVKDTRLPTWRFSKVGDRVRTVSLQPSTQSLRTDLSAATFFHHQL